MSLAIEDNTNYYILGQGSLPAESHSSVGVIPLSTSNVCMGELVILFSFNPSGWMKKLESCMACLNLYSLTLPDIYLIPALLLPVVHPEAYYLFFLFFIEI